MEKETVIYNKSHSKLDLESLLVRNDKMLNQVQHDNSKAIGFTLVELLVVVLIIGILAAVAVPQYEKAVEKGRSAQAITLIKALAQAEEVYFMEHGTYTTQFNELDLGIDINASAYSTRDWQFSLKNVTKSVPRIYAERTAYMNDAPGEHFVGYDLLNKQMYCAADKTNTKGTRFCKNYASTSSPCNHSPGDPCFYF